MDNVYTHGFQVGFNTWQVVAPMMMVIAVAIGWNQYMLTPRLNIKRLYGDWALKLSAFVSGVVFAVLLSVESAQGILQLLDNIFGNDSAFWAAASLIAMPLTSAGLAAGWTALTYYAARMAVWCRTGFLHDKRRAMIRLLRLRKADEWMRELKHQQRLEAEREFQEEAKRQAAEGAEVEAKGLEVAAVALRLPTPPVVPFRVKTREEKEKAI